MYISCVETVREFKKVILLVSVVALTISAAPANLKYTCDKTGVVLAEQKTTLVNIAVASGSGDSLTYCRPANLNLETCKQGQDKNSLTVIYEDVTTSGIIGGKKATFKFYKLTCSDEATHVQHSSIIFKAKAEPTNTHVETGHITHDFTLQLKMGSTEVNKGTDIHIGDTLKIQMTGTDVVITPEICSAYPEGNNSSKVTIWEAVGNDGSKQCKNTEPTVISTEKWSHIPKDSSGIEIILYAFRFAEKAEVVIECTATVCSKSKTTGCTQECVVAATVAPSTNGNTTQKAVANGDGSRKRRSVEIVGKDDSRRKRSSSVSFAVRENKAQYNSSPGLSVGYIKFVTFGLVLLCISCFVESTE